MNKGITSTPKSSVRSFTLLELIVVIVIIGILATLGYTQYSKTVESARLAEAKARIGLMRQLAAEYYLKNGSLDGIQNSDVGVAPGCDPTSFYSYYLGGESTWVNLAAARCTSGGKTPNASRGYNYYLRYYPSTGESSWYCMWGDYSGGCFGLAMW